MKTAALFLAMLVAATQSVAAADCCCIIVCKHREEKCSKCGHEPAAKPAEDDCCKKKEAPAPVERGHAQDGGRCAHLEPSSEVEQQAAPVLHPSPFTLELEPVSIENAGGAVFAPVADGVPCATRGSPPLHLLYSVLLI